MIFDKMAAFCTDFRSPLNPVVGKRGCLSNFGKFSGWISHVNTPLGPYFEPLLEIIPKLHKHDENWNSVLGI